MKTLIIIGIILLVYVVWQLIELQFFKITEYEMTSPKVSREYTMAVVADLHGFRYGKFNWRLLQAVYRQEADAILMPGDLIVSKKKKSYQTACDFFQGIGLSSPMYYSYGNHEQRVTRTSSPFYKQYMEYEKQAEELHVHMLNNKTEILSDEIDITGLTIPLSCYKKGSSVPLPGHYLEETLPKLHAEGTGSSQEGSQEGSTERLHILLAHNPVYALEYAASGADLTVCGHNHGGLIRIPGVGSLISPQFQFFPKYAEGKCSIDGHEVIVSRGLGTHTFHVRIFNRAELVVIRIKPQDIA